MVKREVKVKLNMGMRKAWEPTKRLMNDAPHRANMLFRLRVKMSKMLRKKLVRRSLSSRAFYFRFSSPLAAVRTLRPFENRLSQRFTSQNCPNPRVATP